MAMADGKINCWIKSIINHQSNCSSPLFLNRIWLHLSLTDDRSTFNWINLITFNRVLWRLETFKPNSIQGQRFLARRMLHHKVRNRIKIRKSKNDKYLYFLWLFEQSIHNWPLFIAYYNTETKNSRVQTSNQNSRRNKTRISNVLRLFRIKLKMN